MSLSNNFKICCCNWIMVLSGVAIIGMAGNDVNSSSEFKAADEIISEFNSDARLDIDSRDVEGMLTTRYKLKKVNGVIELSSIDGFISNEMCINSTISYNKVAGGLTISALVRPVGDFCTSKGDSVSISPPLFTVKPPSTCTP